MSVNNAGITGSGVLCSVHNEAIYIESMNEVSSQLDKRPRIFMRENPIFSSESMFHKDYNHKGSVKKEISGRDSEGA